jgi:hypothetical protein
MGRGIFGGIRWRRKQERVTEGMEWLTGPMAKLYISNGRAEEGPNRSCWVILIQKWPLKPGLGLSSRPKPGPKWGPTLDKYITLLLYKITQGNFCIWWKYKTKSPTLQAHGFDTYLEPWNPALSSPTDAAPIQSPQQIIEKIILTFTYKTIPFHSILSEKKCVFYFCSW